MSKIEQFYASKFIEYGFKEIPLNSSYSSIGKLFQLSKEYGEGFYWIYEKKDLYDIKIHDFYYHKDTTLDIKSAEWLDGFNISYCESVSGEEMLPPRNMTAGCLTTFFGGEQSYKAVVHKNVPIRCIGIEILPNYYDQFLQDAYGTEYVNPRDALRSIDPTVQFPEMVNLMRQIWNYRGDGMSAQLFYDSKIAEAISLILSYNQQRTEKKKKEISEQDKELISKVATYISENFNADFTLELLSHIACMGTTKLKSCFKEIYGCTITEYIKQRRLEHAKTLLSTTDTTIEQISKAVGYSNAGRFANDFKKVTKLYPVEYRKTISGGRNK